MTAIVIGLIVAMILLISTLPFDRAEEEAGYGHGGRTQTQARIASMVFAAIISISIGAIWYALHT